MGIDGIGSSAIIALAAVLWFVYLVPTWLRRREYLSTERNAVRLQQTLRIMAETAQVPEAVRVEAHARAIAAQERALRARRAALGDSGPVVLDAPSGGAVSGAVPVSAGAARPSAASRRLRRSRSVTTLVLLAALVGAGFGVAELLASGGWVLLAASLVVAVGSFALLGQMASVARTRREAGVWRQEPVAAELYDDADHAAVTDRRWTPHPVPRPLYLQAREQAGALAAQVGAVAPVAASMHVNRDAREELREAAAEAEAALREATPREAASTRPVREAAPEVVGDSRFARMGFLDDQDASPTDLDQILARRRAVG